MKGIEARKYDPEQMKWPESSLVIYAFEGEEVVGRTAVIDLPHIEGTWVTESKRGTMLANRLIHCIESEIKSYNRTHVFAFAKNDQPEVSQYLERVGYKPFPVSVWMKEL